MNNVAFTCPVCGFALFHPIADLPSSVLGLYSDARFPGRSLLVFKEHFEDLATMPEALAHAFLDDMRLAGRAIHAAQGADRMNYAVLGNAEPHVHAHIFPRRFADDPVPKKSPWSHPEPATPMSNEALNDVAARIISSLRDLQR